MFITCSLLIHNSISRINCSHCNTAYFCCGWVKSPIWEYLINFFSKSYPFQFMEQIWGDCSPPPLKKEKKCWLSQNIYSTTAPISTSQNLHICNLNICTKFTWARSILSYLFSIIALPTIIISERLLKKWYLHWIYSVWPLVIIHKFWK